MLMQNIQAKFEFGDSDPTHYWSRSPKLEKEWNCQLDKIRVVIYIYGKEKSIV